MTAIFDGFREVRYLTIILFILLRTSYKNLVFTTFNMLNFVLIKQYLRKVLVFCFNWKKGAAKAHQMLVEVYGDNEPTDK